VLLILGRALWRFGLRTRRLVRQMPQTLRQLEETLAERYRQELVLQRKLWLLEERGRLMSDLHDGLGGALVSIIAASESERYPRSYISEAARTALNEMRLIVDALDSDEGELRQVLGSWHARNALRMEPFGIRLEVDFQTPDDHEPMVGSADLLNFLRILDELVTNACKHSGGSSVNLTISTIRDEQGQDRCYVTFTDNGRGFPAVVQNGRGMAALQQRAQAIGANITIIATRAGTMVTLLMRPAQRDATLLAPQGLWPAGPAPSR
jgi:signal transduction histidine kinase